MSDTTSSDSPIGDPAADRLRQKLDDALERLEQARPFAKNRYSQQVLDLSRRLLAMPGGVQTLYERAPRMDAAGLFDGTDWENPATLLPGLVNHTLEQGQQATVTLECLSQLRLLAVASGQATHPGTPPEQAQHFLTQVLALNLHRLFGGVDETLRVRLGALGDGVAELFQFLVTHIGYEDILVSLIDEIWRILAQRPIQVDRIKAMVTQISLVLSDGSTNLGEARLGADRLVSALFGPTQNCLDDPGLDAYRARLDAMDATALQQECYGFARSMHDVGLVSDYHAVFLRWLMDNEQTQLIADALGLSSTGLDVLRTYQSLVHELIRRAIYPATSQAVYGLALLLERGIMFAPPIAPGLWRQLALEPSPAAAQSLTFIFGDAVPPQTFLLAGVISLLGQPLGIGQGNNPTCQSARAISMWAYNEPDYLLHLVAKAARFDGILMNFEGAPLNSAFLPLGLARSIPLDTDPVSVILVPHLDRIYQEMGRMCAARGGDPHRWVNPEFHGWWVGRGFFIAVDVTTGGLVDFENFISQFYLSYHPFYNGNQPIIHPQPAGVAVTDSKANFVGWHAITLLRVALDQDNNMRVYFYNPNNDSGQNWGNDVIVSTHGHGERFGEASLPFAELVSRLYIFHDDPVSEFPTAVVPAEEVAKVKEMAENSWAAGRIPPAAAATAGEVDPL